MNAVVLVCKPAAASATKACRREYRRTTVEGE